MVKNFELIYRLISKFPNYLKAFGVLDGFRLLIKVETMRTDKPGKLIKIDTPGYSSPIQLRATVSDRSIYWQCIVRHQYTISNFPHSQKFKNLYDSMVQAGNVPLIIDCGANIGMSVVYFAEEYKKARVVALEPDINNYDMLRVNTAQYRDRVVPILGGIWYESGKLRIINPNAGAAGFRVEQVAAIDESAIQAHTIDEICRNEGVDGPLIVKIDIEGAQAALFSQNTQWIGRAWLIIIELEDWLFPWQGNSRAFFRAMSDYKYEYLIYGDSLFCFRDI